MVLILLHSGSNLLEQSSQTCGSASSSPTVLILLLHRFNPRVLRFSVPLLGIRHWFEKRHPLRSHEWVGVTRERWKIKSGKERNNPFLRREWLKLQNCYIDLNVMNDDYLPAGLNILVNNQRLKLFKLQSIIICFASVWAKRHAPKVVRMFTLVHWVSTN